LRKIEKQVRKLAGMGDHSVVAGGDFVVLPGGVCAGLGGELGEGAVELGAPDEGAN
jgi:hypothetical protein